MTQSSLDLSQQPELALHAEAIASVSRVADSLELDPLIVGAFARDIHLVYAHGIDTRRRTEDVDLALAVPNWAAFDSLQKGLVDGGDFTLGPSTFPRLRHRNGLPIDLVPFGAVETKDRKIEWPHPAERAMDVFGFREAQVKACEIVLPGPMRATVVSLPALALLKVVAWQDRHDVAPLKDAHDLALILKHYLGAGNEPRLWEEFAAWTEDADFDYEFASARMLGNDVAAMLDEEGLCRISDLLARQTDSKEYSTASIELILPSSCCDSKTRRRKPEGQRTSELKRASLNSRTQRAAGRSPAKVPQAHDEEAAGPAPSRKLSLVRSSHVVLVLSVLASPERLNLAG